jgi:hypothetical protein
MKWNCGQDSIWAKMQGWMSGPGSNPVLVNWYGILLSSWAVLGPPVQFQPRPPTSNLERLVKLSRVMVLVMVTTVLQAPEQVGWIRQCHHWSFHRLRTINLTKLVSTVVPGHYFRSGSRLKLNNCQLVHPGLHYTWNTNSGTVGW